MRFIIEFFLFGFIFYLIYVHFPDAFATLLSWAETVYAFFGGLVKSVSERSTTQPVPSGSQVLFFFFSL